MPTTVDRMHSTINFWFEYDLYDSEATAVHDNDPFHIILIIRNGCMQLRIYMSYHLRI